MEIKGTYTFDASVNQSWELLLDTQAVAGCVPGCKELRTIGEDRYQADLVVAVSAVTGNYQITIAIEDRIPPSSYRLVVQGTGRTGFVNGDARIALAPDGARTLVSVAAKADVGGVVARVGQRLLEGVARMMMDRFFACLGEKARSRSGH